MTRYLLVVPAAIMFSFVVNLLIATAATPLTHVPRDFPPFTTLPVLSGSVGGVIMTLAASGVVTLLAGRPDRVFIFAAVAALSLSFTLPLRLSFTKSVWYAGVAGGRRPGTREGGRLRGLRPRRLRHGGGTNVRTA